MIPCANEVVAAVSTARAAMRKRGIVVLREIGCAERQETGSTRDVTSASEPRRPREFTRIFIGQMRRFDHFNRYNPHKLPRPGASGQPAMDRGAVSRTAGRDRSRRSLGTLVRKHGFPVLLHVQ